jgi:serine/threonine-protein kinase HipA
VAVPGVQPKLSLTLIKKTREHATTRLTIVGALGGQYILKPPSSRFPEMVENEHVTMRMAEALGMRVVPSSLIRLKSGELAYVTQRVDRSATGAKTHMLDMFQITEAVDKYKGSMEQIGKALKAHSANPLLDATYLFDLVLFSFVTGNNDMHLKNFSMIEGPHGWILAPAYDLINVAMVLPEDKEELALTLNGKKRKLQRHDFEQFAKTLDLTPRQISLAFQRLETHIPQALVWLNQSFLSQAIKTAYQQVLEKRLNQIGINPTL